MRQWNAASLQSPGRPLRVVLIVQSIGPVVDAIAGSRHPLVGLVQAGDERPAMRRPRRCRFLQSILHLLRGGSGFARAAGCRRVPWFVYASRARDEDFAGWLRERSPDIVLIYGMNWLLKPEILEIPTRGTVNLHPALLPCYRGPRPVQWTFFNMDLEPGVTLHWVDSGEDTGDILYQQQFCIEAGTTWNDYFRKWVEPTSSALFLQALDDVAAGTAPRQRQAQSSPTPRARFIPPACYVSLIDWENWPIARVWHFLRGAPPWVRPVLQLPGAPWWLEWRVREYRAETVEGHAPGRVVRTPEGWCLGCRDGRILLEGAFHPTTLLRRLICP